MKLFAMPVVYYCRYYSCQEDLRVTVKGQVTIPQDIRRKMNIQPGAEVEFIEKDGKSRACQEEPP